MKTKPRTCYVCGVFIESKEIPTKRIQPEGVIITGLSTRCRKGHLQPVDFE